MNVDKNTEGGFSFTNIINMIIPAYNGVVQTSES